MAMPSCMAFMWSTIANAVIDSAVTPMARVEARVERIVNSFVAASVAATDRGRLDAHQRSARRAALCQRAGRDVGLGVLRRKLLCLAAPTVGLGSVQTMRAHAAAQHVNQ